jgi:hypothetical protein
MDDIAEYVRRSTAAQGLPERLEDAATIAQVVALLGGDDDGLLILSAPFQ